MRRGPAPKPAVLKLVDGNTRKLGRKKFAAEIAAEPQAQRGFPDCPNHLTGHACEAWGRLTESLLFMGLDAQVDSLAIQAAATMYGRAMEADIVLAEKGPVEEIPVVVKGVLIGYVSKTRPEEAISRRSWTLYRQYAGDLAANISSRSRLAAAKPKETTDALDEAMFG